MTLNEENKQSKKLFHKYKKTILKAIDLGFKGELIIKPKTLWLGATNNCNIKCIMCYFEKENTYINVDDLKKILKTEIKNKKVFGKTENIDLTAGESLLNPEIYSIVKLLKKKLPKSKISIITNATLPIRGHIAKTLKYIDRIGISIDGANEDTYEFIRRGAKFSNIIKNTQNIVKLKKREINSLCLLFCAMSINVKQLPQWVRLAYFLGIKYLFIQRAEVREKINFDISKFDLLLVDNKKIQNIIDETQKEADRLGMFITFTDIIKNNQKTSISKSAIKMCSMPWNTSPWLFKNKKDVYPGSVCCHMIQNKNTILNQEILKNKSIEKIFNSKQYWDIRKKMILGKFSKNACSKCQYYKMTQWDEDDLKKLKELIK